MRLRLPVSPIFLVLLALLAYIGLRLTLPFGVVAQVAGGLAFASLLWLLPKGFHTRKRDSEWAALVPWLAMGFLSWLLVLTLGRDLTLLASALALSPQDHEAWARASAIAVMASTPLITLIGFFMARRVAGVVRIDVPLAGLPAGLEGFTIAQISDIHVGTTIKRGFVQGIVDRVNRLGADMVAITGDIVDGSV